MARDRREDSQAEAHDVDKFPSLHDGLQQVLRATHVGNVRVRRVDIQFDAAGNATYRFWEGREDEWGVAVAPVK